MRCVRKLMNGFFGVVLATTLVGVVSTAWAEEPKRGGTVVFGTAADPGSMDPGFSSAGTAFTVFNTIYDGLVEKDKTVDASTPPIINALAEAYQISPDGLTYTFKLRKGVKFHDGTPFNAAAVDFNVRRWRDKNFKYYDDVAAGNTSALMQYVKDAKPIDDYNYQFTLNEPMGGFIDNLASLPFFYFVSPEVIKKYGANGLGDHPGGTGPFKVAVYEKDQRIVLDRNDDYWGGARNLDHLIFRVIPDQSTRVAALLSGEIDIAMELPPDAIATVKSDPNLVVYLRGKPHNFSLLPNFREKPFSDPRVREAVSKAIDREAIVNGILRGSARPGTQFYGIGNPGFDETVTKPQDTRDVARAKELLAEAGYPNGFETRMLCTPAGSGVPSTDQIMEFVQSNLADIGIKVKLELMEWNSYLAMYNKGIPTGQNIGAWCMAIGTDTAYVLDMYGHSRNHPPVGWATGWFTDPKVDAILDKANVATSWDDYIRLHQDAQKVVLADYGYVVITHDLGPYGVNKRVKGWVPSRSASQDVSRAWVAN
jgi:peptide/nickel transport system substrate-binding protein